MLFASRRELDRYATLESHRFRSLWDSHLGRFMNDVYNLKRIHSSLGDLTPREFESQRQTAVRLGTTPT